MKELFLLLWNQKEKGVHRSEVISHLWPEMTEDKAAALLHTTVYQLRKAIRDIGIEKPVILRNEHYVLNIQVDSDLDQLNKLLSSSDQNTETITDLLELYQGNYLEKEDYNWAFSRQEDIKRLFLKCVEEFVSSYNTFGDQANLIEDCLKKMIQLEPYKEQYAYTLLDYYGKTKDLQKMIILFQDIKEKWVGELGIDVPKKIQDTYIKYIV